MRKTNERGLSLVELLVALAIFAVIAGIGVYVMRLGVDARGQFAIADRRVAEFEIARLLMKEDFAQVVERPVRDEFGSPAGPAFLGGLETRRRPAIAGETLLLAFVRAGWQNPEASAPRSSLQYVEYVEKQGALIRRSRPYLDDARGQPEIDRILIADLEDAAASFLIGPTATGLAWADGWPLAGEGGNGAPRAVAITIVTPRFGEIRQLFWLGDLAPAGGSAG